VSTAVPVLLRELVDDAAVFPPGSAPIADAVTAHRGYRESWYSRMVGPLLVPAADLAQVGRHAAGGGPLAVGLVGPAPEIVKALDAVPGDVEISHLESPVAKRGEDPVPGVRAFVTLVEERTGYAEIPLTWGLLAALDEIVSARTAGARVAPKFRTGGLAAELFPTPVELAAVICACRDRDLPFKLTAGLHHAARYTDPETGFTHHGFLNVLAGTLAAADGAEEVEVAELLAAADPVALTYTVEPQLSRERPLWVAFGSCSVEEPLHDLRNLGLLPGGPQA